MNKLKARWLILAVFPVGWYISLDLLAAEKLYFTMLTVFAIISASLVLKVLRGPVKREIHLWIIFNLFVIGYYLKFYVLCNFKIDTNSEYIDQVYPFESILLERADLLIKYYEVINIVFFVFAVLVAALSFIKKSSKINSIANELVVPSLIIRKSTVKRVLGFSIVCFIILTYIQVALGLGFVSGAERQVTQLPYHIAGIIMAIYNGIIPLLFLISVWLSGFIRSNYLTKITVSAYLLFGVVAGLISTSKAPLITVVVTLFILWVVTEAITRKRLLMLLLMVPFMGFFNTFLSINRTARVSYPDLGIFEIMWRSGGSLFSTNANLTGYDQPIQHVANYVELILRINGANSLMNIVNYAPAHSLERAWHLMFVSPETIATLYAQDVFGINVDFGVAFSPSLLGYFYFIFGSVVLVCFGMILYTLIWHLLFRALLRSKLLIEPIVFSMLIVIVGLYTSEGTLESMPQSIALIVVFAIFGEFFTRRLVKNSTSMNAYSQPSVRS